MTIPSEKITQEAQRPQEPQTFATFAAVAPQRISLINKAMR